MDVQLLKRATTFGLVIGSPRSGSTLLGAVIDSHSKAIMANETGASGRFWRGLTREEILDEIAQNASVHSSTGWASQVHRYPVHGPARSKTDIIVVGDKIWNTATLLLHGKPSLLPSLQDRM